MSVRTGPRRLELTDFRFVGGPNEHPKKLSSRQVVQCCRHDLEHLRGAGFDVFGSRTESSSNIRIPVIGRSLNTNAPSSRMGRKSLAEIGAGGSMLFNGRALRALVVAVVPLSNACTTTPQTVAANPAKISKVGGLPIFHNTLPIIGRRSFELLLSRLRRANVAAGLADSGRVRCHPRHRARSAPRCGVSRPSRSGPLEAILLVRTKRAMRTIGGLWLGGQ